MIEDNIEDNIDHNIEDVYKDKSKDTIDDNIKEIKHKRPEGSLQPLQQENKRESVCQMIIHKISKWKNSSKAAENRKRFSIYIGIVVVVILMILAVVSLVNRNTIHLSDYITVTYQGANGYASAQCSVDADKLYQDMAGNERDMEKLTYYRELADSVSATIEKQDISNGNVLSVVVSYDTEVASQCGYKIKSAQYNTRASGISAGIKIDLYENVAVTFAGISQEAYVVIENQWEDDYLNSLVFTADQYSSISTDDIVTLECTTSKEDIARHGYIVDKVQAEYQADQLSSYAQGVEDLDSDVLKTMEEDAVKTIQSETESTTFRMLYKVTNDKNYLYQENDETAENVELVGSYFLHKNSDSLSGVDNYIYLLYQTTIKNSTSELQVYIAFEYTQGYIERDGSFDIGRDDPEDRYTCYTSYDEMYETLINQKSSAYEIQSIENK